MSIVHLCDRCGALASTIDTASVTIPASAPCDPTGTPTKVDCGVSLSGLATNHDLCTTCITDMLVEIVSGFKLPITTLNAILQLIQMAIVDQIQVQAEDSISPATPAPTN